MFLGFARGATRHSKTMNATMGTLVGGGGEDGLIAHVFIGPSEVRSVEGGGASMTRES